MILFGLQLISEPCSIHHRLLCLLLGVLGLLQHLVHLRVDGVHAALQGTLVARRLWIDVIYLVGSS